MTAPNTDPRPSPSVGVSVPAHPPSIDLFRTVISSLATQLDFSLEEISDIGLAAEEACAYLLTSFPGPERVDIRITLEDALLDVSVRLDGPADPAPSEARRRTLLREVLSALTDEVDLASADGVPAVSFRKSARRR